MLVVAYHQNSGVTRVVVDGQTYRVTGAVSCVAIRGEVQVTFVSEDGEQHKFKDADFQSFIT